MNTWNLNWFLFKRFYIQTGYLDYICSTSNIWYKWEVIKCWYIYRTLSQLYSRWDKKTILPKYNLCAFIQINYVNYINIFCVWHIKANIMKCGIIQYGVDCSYTFGICCLDSVEISVNAKWTIGHILLFTVLT